MKIEWATVSSVAPDDPETWNQKCFLTFDIDWAHDEVLEDTIDLLEKADVSATWFITHDTPLLARLRKNPKLELGIHPNFTFLLQGDDRNGKCAEEVIDRLMTIVPEAKSVRSHNLLQGTYVLKVLQSRGLTHECNQFMPEQVGVELAPWVHWGGLVRVPHYWEDDVACLYERNASIGDLFQRPGIKVFDFHPIHVFLNTENMERYENTRPLHRKPSELIENRYEGAGVRTRLLELLSASESHLPKSGDSNVQ